MKSPFFWKFSLIVQSKLFRKADFSIRITPQTTNILTSEVLPLISSLDGRGATYFHNDRIGSGDVLTITIFELGSE